MERRRFFAGAAAGAGAAIVTGLAASTEAAGFTELDVQAQLSSMGTVTLPAGQVLISKGLRLPSRAILRGAGLHTVLRAASGLTAPVIRLVQPDATAAEREIQGCGIENLTSLYWGNEWALAVDFVIFVLVLSLKPSGIFGRQTA